MSEASIDPPCIWQKRPEDVYQSVEQQHYAVFIPGQKESYDPEYEFINLSDKSHKNQAFLLPFTNIDLDR